MSSDHRKYKRFLVENLDVHAKTIVLSEIQILDIGMGGARVRGTKSLKFGQKYAIRLENKYRHFTIDCIVVWSRLGGSFKDNSGNIVPLYSAGIEFTSTVSEKLNDLLSFINDYSDNIEKRVDGLRFKISGDKPAVLHHDESRLVKKISLGGMLIEAGNEIAIDEVMPLELYLPGDEYPLKLEGRVAFCERIREEQLGYDVGLAFADISTEDLLRLRHFITLLPDYNGKTKDELPPMPG